MHNDSDEELGARLDAALRANLEHDRVDVAALLVGSRTRARRVRSQRIAMIASAAVLVLAVPVGYEVIRPDQNQVVQPSALLPSSSLSALPGPLPSPTRTLPPTPAVTSEVITPAPIRKTPPPTPPRTSSTKAVSAVYRIPDSVALTATELPEGVSLTDDSTYLKVPTSPGQGCDPGNAKGARPIVAREWTWVDGSGKMTSTAVDLIVTGWRTGTGKVAFDELVADTGYCSWSDPQTEEDFSAAGSDQSWSATSTYGSLQYGRVVVRLGDVIAAVEVQHADGTAEALKIADELAVAGVKHLRNSGLAAVK